MYQAQFLLHSGEDVDEMFTELLKYGYPPLALHGGQETNDGKRESPQLCDVWMLGSKGTVGGFCYFTSFKILKVFIFGLFCEAFGVVLMVFFWQGCF